MALTLDEQLVELRNHVRVRIDDVDVQHVPAELWQQRCPGTSLTEIYQRFAQAGGRNNNVKIVLNFITDPKILNEIDIRHNSDFSDGEDDNLIRFEWSNGEAFGKKFYLRPEDRNQHLAKHYRKASVDFLRAMHVTSLHTDTAEMGSYAWAKYGFVPDEAGLKKVQSLIGDAFQGKPSKLLIADKTHLLTPAERIIVDAFIKSEPNELAGLFTQLSEMNRVIGEFRGHPLTIGKALLYNTKWSGILPLKDGDPNYQRFCDYVDSAPARTLGAA